MRSLLSALLIMVLVCAAAAQGKRRAQGGAAHAPTLLFISDFGDVDDSVAICKGVMLGVEPRLNIIDITHNVTPYSILDGARFLAGTSPFYGAGTVFVAVVDPGVGSARRAIVVKTRRGHYFVLPDNGLITLVAAQDGIVAAREITNSNWMVGNALSSTFHGRDIFSPVGARLARGDDWAQVGPVVSDLVKLDVLAAKLDERGASGEVIALDGPYGNLVTNIDADLFRQLGYSIGDRVRATIGGKAIELPFVKTFSDVAVNSPLIYIDSRGRLALAVNQASFAEIYQIKPPARIAIPRRNVK